MLKSDDNFIADGETWKRPDPLIGLKVQRGRHALEVTLWHDEFPTVRTIKSEFAEAVTADVPVQLHVTIQPAQGNARVDVIPAVKDVGVRNLRLERRHMRDEKLSPEAWLRQQPTNFPPLLRRVASAAQ